jgi:hypothetical protein
MQNGTELYTINNQLLLLLSSVVLLLVVFVGGLQFAACYVTLDDDKFLFFYPS